MYRHAARWEAGGAAAPPDFGGSNSAAGSGGAPPFHRPPQIFRLCCIPVCTVKLGNKKQFDKEQIGIKEPFPVTNLPFTSFR